MGSKVAQAFLSGDQKAYQKASQELMNMYQYGDPSYELTDPLTQKPYKPGDTIRGWKGGGDNVEYTYQTYGDKAVPMWMDPWQEEHRKNHAQIVRDMAAKMSTPASYAEASARAALPNAQPYYDGNIYTYGDPLVDLERLGSFSISKFAGSDSRPEVITFLSDPYEKKNPWEMFDEWGAPLPGTKCYVQPNQP
jgi:hypothetical protein